MKKDYLDVIIELLRDDDRREKMRSDMIQNVSFNTWSDVVDKWEKVIGKERQQEDRT